MIWTRFLEWGIGRAYGSPGDVELGDCRALCVVADGVGGLDLCSTSLRHVARRTGTGLRVEGASWSHGWGRWFADLTDRSHASEWSARVAERVEKALCDGIGRVSLVGKSGGCGIVVGALERLPAESVDVAVLLAPAVSPNYDLEPALRAVRRKLIVFWSPLDLLILGAGTLVFGTIDRRHTISAGLVGFRNVDRLSPAALGKFEQIRWTPVMCRTGYFGGHVGPDLPWFLERYVAPILSDGAAGVRGPGLAV
jgi:hypothetical protein